MSDFSSAASLNDNTLPIPINNNNSNNIIHQHQPTKYPDPSLNASFRKRTLSNFQYQNQHFPQHHNTLLQLPQGIGPRSLKPRIYQNPSPIEFLPRNNNNNNNAAAYIGRYPVLRPQNHTIDPHVPTPPPPYNGAVLVPGKPTDNTETEKKKMMIMNRLQELEKQLLDDEDIDDDDKHASGDSVSVITGNEWTETIQNLIATDPPPQQQVVNTSSPTTSSSSSSCSSTVAYPLPICTKQLVIEAAAAIADGKMESAAEIVTRVAQSANPRGTPEQRLAYYMSQSLKSRLNSVAEDQNKSSSSSAIRSKEHYESVQLLYNNSACFKLGFVAANLAIIEATADANSLHVVDFDLGDGKQYHTLLQWLSLRKSGKPASVRITAVDVLERNGDEERSRVALERLSQLGERVGVPLDLKTLRLNRVGDLSREWLGSSEGQVLAVNLAYILSKLPDEGVSTENQRDELLRRVKGLKARIVTVVEQEMNCNTAPFQTRVAECCSFYGALLDSMGSMGIEDAERIRVEGGLGRVMRNTVECEGGERVERCEVLGKWRARLGMAGFEMKRVSQNVVESLSSRIVSNNTNSGCAAGGRLFVKEVNGAVCFGWMGRILTVTSACR